MRIALACLLVLLALPSQAAIRAWLDRDRIGAGETATLNIETDEAGAPTPDFAALQGDFDLSGHTSSRQLEIVNGTSRVRVLYAVALRPRGTGDFAVPALRVGGQRTAPLSLSVVAAEPASARSGDALFIETQVDAASPYVQQAVGYVVRLYYATSVLSGSLDQDPPQGASLQRVGEDVRYQRDIGGRRYSVVERRYLLIPDRSGSLSIPGARFAGQGMGGFFDDLFGDGRRELSARAAPRTLRVRPMPAGAPRPWLPLRGLDLRYVSTPQSARVGEAATIEVEADADGATGAQMPALELGAVDGAQVFADPPRIEERFEQGRPHARVVRRFAVVPTRDGTLRIPAPRIAWWDAGAGVARTASLPDFALPVAAASGAPRDAGSDARRVRPAAGADDARWIEVPFVQGAVHPWALATIAFALLWLVTLWWALHRRARAAAPASQEADERRPVAPPARDLRGALASGDLASIERALCAAAIPAADDLAAVCARLDDAAQVEAVRVLQRARWGGGADASVLDALRAAFRAGPRWRAAPRTQTPLLPPLYPE